MSTNVGFALPSSPSDLMQAREARLLQNHGLSTGKDDASKINKSAREFEAILVGTWLQQAEQSFATVPGGDEEDDAGKGQMMSMGVQALSTSIAASGGIGIAKMVAGALHRSEETENKSPVAANSGAK
ncbi:hypothetical protein DYQ86_00225 [Acidobacteria bacterium AB60]|nr:hypothetical protein DYQ86_00225 [Acidobacteria bacterium AB60]